MLGFGWKCIEEEGGKRVGLW